MNPDVFVSVRRCSPNETCQFTDGVSRATTQRSAHLGMLEDNVPLFSLHKYLEVIPNTVVRVLPKKKHCIVRVLNFRSRVNGQQVISSEQDNSTLPCWVRLFV